MKRAAWHLVGIPLALALRLVVTLVIAPEISTWQRSRPMKGRQTIALSFMSQLITSALQTAFF